MTRIELVNLFLTKEALYRLSYMGPKKAIQINLKYLTQTIILEIERRGAGDEVRTRDIQLGRLKLYQLSYSRFYLVVGGGFEPPKASPTDLQSVPFDHSGTPPYDQLLTLEPAEGIEPPTH